MKLRSPWKITLFAMYTMVQNLYSRFKFSCLVFLGMELRKNEVETKKIKLHSRIKLNLNNYLANKWCGL